MVKTERNRLPRQEPRDVRCDHGQPTSLARVVFELSGDRIPGSILVDNLNELYPRILLENDIETFLSGVLKPAEKVF